VKMLIADWYPVPIGLSLAVIAAVLAISIVASLLFPQEEEQAALRPTAVPGEPPVAPIEPTPEVAEAEADAEGSARSDGPQPEPAERDE